MEQKPTADGGGDGNWQTAALRYLAKSLFAKAIVALVVIYYVVAVVGAAVGKFDLEWRGFFPIVTVKANFMLSNALRPASAPAAESPVGPKTSALSVAASTPPTSASAPPVAPPPLEPRPVSAGDLFDGGFGKTLHELTEKGITVFRENNSTISYAQQDVLGYSMTVYQDVDSIGKKTARAHGVIKFEGYENPNEGSSGTSAELVERKCGKSGLTQLMEIAREKYGVPDNVAYPTPVENDDGKSETRVEENSAVWNFSDKSRLIAKTSFVRTWWSANRSGWRCSVEICAVPANGGSCLGL
ncbi:hypothetical protein [Paraburkholderia bannensis]|uniref:hypothetical protein n=1 Tax=Paraburkholderia bannensis TaxID=765414 RepID=UPI002AB66405|nr:hypothetical protein [Paraburkholderia bannensis]